MKRRKKTKLLQGCPRCGGPWTKQSGLIVCGKCGHQHGSQNPHSLTSQFGQVIRPGQAQLLGQSPLVALDDEERLPGDKPGRQDREVEIGEPRPNQKPWRLKERRP